MLIAYGASEGEAVAAKGEGCVVDRHCMTLCDVGGNHSPGKEQTMDRRAIKGSKE